MAVPFNFVLKTESNTAALKRATLEAQEFVKTLREGVSLNFGQEVAKGIGQLPGLFAEAVKGGVRFNAEIEDAQLSLAGLIRTAHPERFQSMSAAMAESARGVSALRQAALSTTSSFSELHESLIALSGPLYAGGAKELQKQVDLVARLSEAAKAINVPSSSFTSDARDLIGGAGGTQLGKGLHISDEEIQKASRSGTVIDLLTQKLSKFDEVSQASSESFSNRISKLMKSLEEVEAQSTEGFTAQLSDVTANVTKSVNAPAFANDMKAVGAEITVLLERYRPLIEAVASSPIYFVALAQGVTTFGVALAVLNLPRFALALGSMAAKAAPNIAQLMGLGKAAAGVGASTAAATPSIEANTKALEANAVAAQTATKSQSAAGAASKNPTKGAQFLAMAGPAATAVMAVVELTTAVSAYREIIKQADKDLASMLTGQTESYAKAASEVTTTADQAKVLTQVNQQIAATEEAIKRAKAQGLYTDEGTVKALQQHKVELNGIKVSIQSTSSAMLDQRAATDAANRSLEEQARKMEHIKGTFQEAMLGYRELQASLQEGLGKTVGDRQAGVKAQITNELEKFNQLTSSAFKTPKELTDYVAKAETQHPNLVSNQQAADKTLAELNEKVEAKKKEIAKAAEEKEAADAQTRRGGDARRKNAAKALEDKTKEGIDLKDELKRAEDKATNAQLAVDNDTKKLTAALPLVTKLRDLQGQSQSLAQEKANSSRTTEEAQLQKKETLLENSYKNRTISLDDYLVSKQEMLDQAGKLERQTIENKYPDNEKDDLKKDELAQLDEKQAAKQAALNQEGIEKRRAESLATMGDEQRILKLQQQQATAVGDLNRAKELGLQNSILQAKAEIQANERLSPEQKAAAINATTQALTQQFVATQNQEHAEKSLQLAEQRSSETMSLLAAKRQAIDSSTLGADARQSALRQTLLAENVELDNQIALLEQRRQLALADPTKTPEDRAVAAQGIQGQITQAKQQQLTNQTAADHARPFDTFKGSLTQFSNSFGTTASQIAGVFTGTLSTGVESFSKQLTDVVTGAQDIKAAFVNMALATIEQLIQLAIKLAVVLTLQTALDFATGGGAAVGGGLMGLLGLAEGGMVPGAPSHRDNRLAAVASGEFVTRTAAVQHYGPGLFAALNRMSIPRASLGAWDMPVRARASTSFAEGGLVGPMPTFAAAAAPSAPAPAIHVAFVNDRQSHEEFLRNGPGRKIMIDLVNGKMRDLGVTR